MNLLRVGALLVAGFLCATPSWAAFGFPGTYTNTNAPKTSGAQSVTNVTVPTHTSAIVAFHYFHTGAAAIINNTTTLPVLSGGACTHVASKVDNTTTQDSVQVFWCTGGVVGSSKTLSYTIDATIDFGMGISILFLSGSETTGIIRASATDGDDAGASSSGAMTFSAGDLTVAAYTSDTDASPTNGGANTAGVTQYTTNDSMIAGIYYKTADGTISMGGGSAMGFVGMTIKPAAGGATDETFGFRKRRSGK